MFMCLCVCGDLVFVDNLLCCVVKYVCMWCSLHTAGARCLGACVHTCLEFLICSVCVNTISVVGVCMCVCVCVRVCVVHMSE